MALIATTEFEFDPVILPPPRHFVNYEKYLDTARELSRCTLLVRLEQRHY